MSATQKNLTILSGKLISPQRIGLVGFCYLAVNLIDGFENEVKPNKKPDSDCNRSPAEWFIFKESDVLI